MFLLEDNRLKNWVKLTNSAFTTGIAHYFFVNRRDMGAIFKSPDLNK